MKITDKAELSSCGLTWAVVFISSLLGIILKGEKVLKKHPFITLTPRYTHTLLPSIKTSSEIKMKN
jgi:hypothetical protein